MPGFLTKRAVLLAKIQTAEGSPATLDPAVDALLISDLNWNPNGEPIERNFLRDSLSPLPFRQGRKLMEATFGFELKAGPTAGVAPEVSPLLRAAGMSETIVAVTSVTYNFRDTAFEFATIGMYIDGMLVKIEDAIIDITSINFEAGKIPMVQAKATGKYVTPTDVALPTGVYDTHLPPLNVSQLITFDAFAVGVIPNWSINFANQIAERRDCNSAQGYKGSRLVGRAPTGQMTMEQETVAAFPAVTRFENATEMTFTAKVGVTPQLLTFTSPSVQITSLASADINGIRGWNLGLRFNSPSVAKEFTIAIT